MAQANDNRTYIYRIRRKKDGRFLVSGDVSTNLQWLSKYEVVATEITVHGEQVVEAVDFANFKEDLEKEIEMKEGDYVEFRGDDSHYGGQVVCVFTKKDGESTRCIVEDSRGLLLIKNPDRGQLCGHVYGDRRATGHRDEWREVCKKCGHENIFEKDYR